ncbi:MAG: hypothetical protein ABF503_14375, partial [Lacticaseibacillus paracasei]
TFYGCLLHLHMINNHNVQFVKVEYPYTWASTPSGFNKIKSIKGSPCTFKTKYLLPNTHAISNNVNYNTSNPQSMAYVGKYLFIVYSPHNDGKGFIIRYNTNKFNKKSFKETQQLSLKKNISGIKIGPQITIGHGQSLAYNKKNHTLWMWKDRSDMKPTKESIIQQISTSKLVPNKTIKFTMDNRGVLISAGHNLTFDSNGHAYWWTVSHGSVKIYRGVLKQHSIKVELIKQLLKHSTGTHEQSIGYNSRNGRLYLVSDDSIQSLPISKTFNKSILKPNNIRYTRFDSGREFEGIDFDNSGHAILLKNRTPEAMISEHQF